MRSSIISLTLLVFSWSWGVHAFAQESIKYDPVMEKRADLRLQWIHAQHIAAMKEAAEQKEEHAQPRVRYFRHKDDGTETELVRAQGSPYLLDFRALSSKRSDLRLDSVQHGLDSAFTDWLRRERPWAYRQYLSDIAH